MSASGLITVAIEAFGGLLSFVLALSLALVKDRRDAMQRLIVGAFVLGGSAQLFDMTAWLVEGHPGPTAHALMEGAVFLTFACDFAHMGVLVTYFAAYMGEHIPSFSGRRVTRSCWLLAAFMLVLLAANQLFPAFYFIDASNVYQETELWSLVSLIALLVFPVYGLAMTVRSRPRLNPFVAAVLIAAPLVMIAVFLIQSATGGANLSYLAVTACTVLLYLSVQQENAREYAARRLAIEQHETDLLLSQIRPHFLYNAITTIYGLVDIDPREAQAAVCDFSAYLRANVGALDRTGPVPFEEELAHVRAYLALERRRFGDRIAVEERLGPTAFAVPPLTVQPLVENAVHHGLAGCDATVRVSIATRERPTCFEVEVHDDGAGFDPAATAVPDGRTHVGLVSVRERVAHMAGGTLEVSSRPRKGTTAIVRIPKPQPGASARPAPLEKGLS